MWQFNLEIGQAASLGFIRLDIFWLDNHLNVIIWQICLGNLARQDIHYLNYIWSRLINCVLRSTISNFFFILKTVALRPWVSWKFQLRKFFILFCWIRDVVDMHLQHIFAFNLLSLLRLRLFLFVLSFQNSKAMLWSIFLIKVVRFQRWSWIWN